MNRVYEITELLARFKDFQQGVTEMVQDYQNTFIGLSKR